MKITWRKTPLTSKETYAKEKYVCKLYDTRCELYLWHNDTWIAIDDVFECRLKAENLEEATKETIQWFLERIDRRIEERQKELNKVAEKLRKATFIKEELENCEIEIEI